MLERRAVHRHRQTGHLVDQGQIGQAQRPRDVLAEEKLQHVDPGALGLAVVHGERLHRRRVNVGPDEGFGVGFRGRVFDVAVDLRSDSPTLGRWHGIELSDENHRQLWVPPGFAHGFLVLSEIADVLYKTTDYYWPEHEHAIRWDDPELGIEWPISERPTLSEKDSSAGPFASAELFR